MRIVIVSAFFRPGLMYLENLLAELLGQMGHTVRVVASFAGAGPDESTSDSPAKRDDRYELCRVRCLRLPGSYYLFSHKATSAVRQFQPELIVWIGPARLFGRGIPRDPALANVPLVITCSECIGWHEFDYRKPGIVLGQRMRALAYRLLRGPTVRAACRASALVVGVTPETPDILAGLFSPGPERDAMADKMLVLPLGFHPGITRWDPALRQAVRRELQLAPGDVVVAMSSRFTRPKAALLQTMVDGLGRAVAREPAIRPLVIGLDDGAVSRDIRRAIADDPGAKRFVCHDFTDQARLNALYNAADIAVFGNCSISVQSAMGTGLLACLADNGTMDHLVRSPDVGVYFRTGDVSDLAEKLAGAVRHHVGLSDAERLEARERRVGQNAWLGYDRILAAILDRIGLADGAADSE